eukprot:1139593-Pelagomonas_calceolata.AAC.2
MSKFNGMLVVKSQLFKLLKGMLNVTGPTNTQKEGIWSLRACGERCLNDDSLGEGMMGWWTSFEALLIFSSTSGNNIAQIVRVAAHVGMLQGMLKA